MQISNHYNVSYNNFVKKDIQNTGADTKSSFSDAVAVKTAEVDSNEVRKKTSAVLDAVGSQASDEVKNAWMEAEEETGAFFTVFGLYITSDGKHAHMTQMGIDRFVRWYRGEINPDDLLGSSVESAIKAVNKWMYDLDHPLAGQTARSMEERQLIMKEREFYEVFLNNQIKIALLFLFGYNCIAYIYSAMTRRACLFSDLVCKVSLRRFLQRNFTNTLDNLSLN